MEEVLLPNPEHLGNTATMRHRDSRTLGGQLEKVATDVQTLGRMAKDDAKRKLVDARDRGERLYGRIRTKGRAAIESRPLTSLTAAAGLGALACLMWTKGLGR